MSIIVQGLQLVGGTKESASEINVLQWVLVNDVTAVGCSWEMTTEISCSAFSIYAAVTHFQINALHVAVTSRATKNKKLIPQIIFIAWSGSRKFKSLRKIHWILTGELLE